MNDPTKAVHVIISGRVQGVWYRAWTKQKADGLGLTGWVRNRDEGTVEAVFCGSDDKIQQMLQACRKGPPLARVDKIDQHNVDPSEVLEAQGFEKRPTV